DPLAAARHARLSAAKKRLGQVRAHRLHRAAGGEVSADRARAIRRGRRRTERDPSRTSRAAGLDPATWGNLQERVLPSRSGVRTPAPGADTKRNRDTPRRATLPGVHTGPFLARSGPRRVRSAGKAAYAVTARSKEAL